MGRAGRSGFGCFLTAAEQRRGRSWKRPPFLIQKCRAPPLSDPNRAAASEGGIRLSPGSIPGRVLLREAVPSAAPLPAQRVNRHGKG